MPSTDALLARLATAARDGADLRALLDEVELRRNRWEAGYRRADVDSFLTWLRERVSAGPGVMPAWQRP